MLALPLTRRAARRLLSGSPSSQLNELSSRAFTVSAVASYAGKAQASKSKGANASAANDEDDGNKDIPYAEWLTSTGRRFKKAERPRNWLGKKGPFPLNPSFKPPVPISDELKTHMYRLFMADPATNSVRELALKYKISMKRVDAILRLKGLQEHWKETGQTLQRGYLKQMEFHLGVDAEKVDLRRGLMSSTETLLDSRGVHNIWLYKRDRLSDADLLDHQIGHEITRARYERLFYEPVVESDDPVVPFAIDMAREGYKNATEKAAKEAWSPDLLKTASDPLRAREVSNMSGTARSRPRMKFVDVGGRFVNVREQAIRARAAKHRATLRAQKAAGVGSAHSNISTRAAKRHRIDTVRRFKRVALRRINRASLRAPKTAARRATISGLHARIQRKTKLEQARQRLEEVKAQIQAADAKLAEKKAAKKARKGTA